MNDQTDFKKAALDYHAYPNPGKLDIRPAKSFITPQDLSLGYTPGVAIPCLEIAKNPEDVYKYTSKGNLVGVVSNGTAVLGLGNIGALASKPVMEGKANLFKKFADVDAMDIEVDEEEPQKFVDTVQRIAPTFGAILLEDIKAPECFVIEEELSKRVNIPVFHDDQHGTAVVIAAALFNSLELQNKISSEIKVVCLGAGAAAIASMDFLITMGIPRSSICMVDSKGVISTNRTDLSKHKARFAIDTAHTTLAQAIAGADVFIGLCGQGQAFSSDMLASMNTKPIVLALSNPYPEIHPELAKSVRQDLIIATGLSNHPNQVNNSVCFPYLFRGALDVRAKLINQDMLVAAAHAIKNLARQLIPNEILQLYGIESLEFGRDYILPRQFDRRLLEVVPAAVAKAAIDSGVASLAYPAHYAASV